MKFVQGTEWIYLGIKEDDNFSLKIQSVKKSFDLYGLYSDNILPDRTNFDFLMKDETSVIISSETFAHQNDSLILAIYFHHASNEELSILMESSSLIRQL